MHKVLIITYYFPPSGGAGVQRWLKFCKYLPSCGIKPIVLTVDEQYASYPQIDTSLSEDIPKDLCVIKTKTREVLQLYKRFSLKGQLPHTGFANVSKPSFAQKCMKFIRGNFFLPDPRKGWNKFAYKEACRLIEEENITTVVTTSPPHSSQLIGWRLKRHYPHIKWVADLRDPWTELYANKDLFQTCFSKKINERMEKKVLNTADEIITVSPSCASIFASKCNRLVRVVTNGYDEKDFEGMTVSPESKFTISYVGALSPLYETDTLLVALQQLSDEERSKIKIRFVGGAFADIKSKLQALKIDTEWVDYVQHQQAIKYMYQTDLLLLLFPQQSDNKGILTGKLFEYMATGKPILMIGFKDGDAANILQQYEEKGVFAFGEDKEVAQFIAKSMKALPLTHPTIAQQYSRKSLTQQIAQWIISV